MAIDNVSYLAHYIIGDRCILANIGEMHTTNHAKFGNGILKDGEPETARVWLYLMNEACPAHKKNHPSIGWFSMVVFVPSLPSSLRFYATRTLGAYRHNSNA